MKKYSWIVALLLALSLAFLGCPNEPKKTGGGENDVREWELVFDMSEHAGIQALSGTLTFGTGDANNPIRPLVRAAEDAHATFEAVTLENGKVGIKYTTKADWGVGIDLPTAAFGLFGGNEAYPKGDKIVVTGEYVTVGNSWAGGNAAQIHFNSKLGGMPVIIGDNKITEAGPFTITIDELTEADLASIASGDAPKSLRLEARGEGNVVVIHNIVVEGYRPVEVKTLTAPVLNDIDGDEASWSAVDGASGYKVYAGEDLLSTVAATSLNLKTALEGKAGGTYSITVVAAGSGTKVLDSPKSNAKDYVYAPYVAVFEVDGTTLKHTNPRFIKHGSWGTADLEIEDGVATIPEGKQANFAYVYPTQTGFDINEWDFVELKLTTTGTIKNFGYKIYPSIDNDAVAGRTGALANDDDATIKLEIRKIPEGLGFQKYSGATAGVDDEEIVIEITEAVFSKGTRYNITLDGNGGAVTPTTTYLVDGTKVANHLPVATQAGKTFVGWKTDSNIWALDSTDVDSTFNNATFKAQWIDAKTIAPIAIAGTNVTAVSPGTVSNATATSYDYASGGYGNGFAKFTLNLGSGNVLANLDKVTFTVKVTGSDGGWKTVHLLAATSLSSNATTGSVGSFYINGSMGADTNVTVVIDKAKAFALTGSTLECSLFIDAPATATYTISNITFAQNE